jgi:hypothetical protein
MKTMFVQAYHINHKIRRALRRGHSMMLQSGAKLYARKVGSVWHYFISGYAADGSDVKFYSWAALKTDPLYYNNMGDTDGDFITPLNLEDMAKLGWLKN